MIAGCLRLALEGPVDHGEGMTLLKSLWHGLLAGAAGTTALNVVSYADMARRGRDASSAPSDLVAEAATRHDVEVPGEGDERANRLSALGALRGSASGLGIGALGGVLRGVGVRPGAIAGSVVAGAGAMAATDGALAAYGVSDPASWSRADWVADAVPHLAYGALTHATLAALERRDAPVRKDGLPPRPAGAGLLARCALLGVAAGSRSSLGLAAPVLGRLRRSDRSRKHAGTSVLAEVEMSDRAEVMLTAVAPPPAPSTPAVLLASAAVVQELVIDKRPETPSRLAAGGLGARLVSGAAGSVALCRQEDATSFWPAVAGGLGAFAGARGGAAWRSAATRWMPDWQAALVEDGVALTAAAVAALTGRR